MSKVYFFSEYGNGIGLGHVTRLSTISSQLVKFGREVEFILYNKGFQELNLPYPTKYINWIAGDMQIERYLTKKDIAVVDSYLASKDVFKRIGLNAKYTFAIDDYNRIEYPVDFVLNPNVYGESVQYTDSLPEFLLGSKYSLLRNEILSYKKETSSPTQTSLFVTMGGSDYRGLIPKLMPFFISLKKKGYVVNIVCGSEEYKKELQLSFPEMGNSVLGYLDADRMFLFMHQSDIAISAGGQTLIELSYIGLPFIPIEIDLDQEENINFFKSNRLVHSRIKWDDRDLEFKLSEVLESVNSWDERERFRIQSQKLVDGRGADRVAQYIINKMQND